MNSVNIIGYITKDPVLKETKNGKKYCNFVTAVNSGFGKNQKTAFVNCIIWNNGAEALCKNGRKGFRVAISGHIQTGTYKKEKETKYHVHVVVDNIMYVTSKNK